jgi:cysteine-rich repeat protein
VLGASIGVALVFVAACRGPADDSQPASGDSLRTCVPHQSLVCLCAGIDEGVQTCTEEGVLTPCVCEPKKPVVTPVPTSTQGPIPRPGPACGDATVDPGEACDDGNTKSGDGCSSKCQPDGAPASGEACPGQPVRLWKGSTVILNGTTDGFTDDVEASCWASTGADRIFAIRPTAAGLMAVDVVLGAAFNAVVELRKDACNAPTSQLLCEDTLSRPFKRLIEVQPTSTYYLIVDGDSEPTRGGFTIRLELP